MLGNGPNWRSGSQYFHIRLHEKMFLGTLIGNTGILVSKEDRSGKPDCTGKECIDKANMVGAAARTDAR